MFKKFHRHTPQVHTEPVKEGDAATLCASYIEHSDDLTYNALVRECTNIGNHSLKSNFYVPPSHRKVYLKYDGTGIISVDRTIHLICTHGRGLDTIISRKHITNRLQSSLTILIDNSAQMTANWLSEKLEEKIESKEAPHILAKISAIAILEGLGRDVDEIDIIMYEDDAKGPFNQHQLPYKHLLKFEGNGLSRLDFGLAKLLQLEWELRPGNKHLFILGGGLPFTGTNILIDDMEVQVNVLYYLSRMIRQGVKVMYLPFFTREEHLNERVGAFSPRSLARNMQKMGVVVSEINNVASLPSGLRKGFKEMMAGKKKYMPLFEV